MGQLDWERNEKFTQFLRLFIWRTFLEIVHFFHGSFPFLCCQKLADSADHMLARVFPAIDDRERPGERVHSPPLKLSQKSAIYFHILLPQRFESQSFQNEKYSTV
jgi:hypothetical protein